MKSVFQVTAKGALKVVLKKVQLKLSHEHQILDALSIKLHLA